MSLYDEHSALVRLNRDGSLDDPPLDLVRVLAEGAQYHALSIWGVRRDGAAAVAIFTRRISAGPTPIRQGRRPMRYGSARTRRPDLRSSSAPARIRFARPGMGITLNGIGQGYITDRVVELLQADGVEHALVDMGETRAIGAHPSGEPWRVGIEDPGMPGEIAERIAADGPRHRDVRRLRHAIRRGRAVQPHLRPDQWSHFLSVSGGFDDRIDGNRGRRAFHRVLPHAARTDPRSGTSPQVKRAPGNAGWTARIDGGLTRALHGWLN